MKSMIFISALLMFALCSSSTIDYDHMLESSLVELTKQPAAEAVFATISTEIKGSAGFHKILALLNELVKDGRKQYHENTVIFRGVSGRCEVNKFTLRNKQFFFESAAERLQTRLENARRAHGEAQDTVKERKGAEKFLKHFEKAVHARHGIVNGELSKAKVALANGLKRVGNAINAVNAWNAKHGNAFIQKHLEDVTSSYLELKHFKITIPESFVETAASDHQVKKRMLEWLGMIKMQFLTIKSHLKGAAHDISDLAQELEKACKEILKDVAKEIGNDQKGVVVYGNAISHNAKGLKLFNGLVKSNAKLIESNKQYCSVEHHNYRKAVKEIKENTKLFTQVRNYFIRHYSKVNAWIKARYH